MKRTAFTAPEASHLRRGFGFQLERRARFCAIVRT